ncbi:MAG: hypothetical protein CFE21_08890 [Bacteroidetes bacterium B1(2017)]|nr:MAG: hypothetical protein CFE21_08890 [Bacteroidetes bacterium B1(2017)]
MNKQFPLIIEFSIASLQNLRILSKDFLERIWVRNNLSADLGFCWVYGLSEVELVDFARLCEGVIQEIRHTISISTDKLLSDKLGQILADFPLLDIREFIINTDTGSWLFKSLWVFKKIRQTIKFKHLVEEIIACCDRFIHVIENKEFLELETNVSIPINNY